ncbi:MAG: hypothetical protein R3F54_15805 [Alphaproteobacteria bacterium]
MASRSIISDLVLVLVALISAPLVLASPWIVAAYGPDFQSGVTGLHRHARRRRGRGTQGIGSYLAAENRFWLRFHVNLLWAICYLAAAFYLVVEVIGLAIALIIAYSARTLTTLLYVLRAKGGEGNEPLRADGASQRDDQPSSPRSSIDAATGRSPIPSMVDRTTLPPLASGASTVLPIRRVGDNDETPPFCLARIGKRVAFDRHRTPVPDPKRRHRRSASSSRVKVSIDPGSCRCAFTASA